MTVGGIFSLTEANAEKDPQIHGLAKDLVCDQDGSNCYGLT